MELVDSGSTCLGLARVLNCDRSDDDATAPEVTIGTGLGLCAAALLRGVSPFEDAVLLSNRDRQDSDKHGETGADGTEVWSVSCVDAGSVPSTLSSGSSLGCGTAISILTLVPVNCCDGDTLGSVTYSVA